MDDHNTAMQIFDLGDTCEPVPCEKDLAAVKAQQGEGNSYHRGRNESIVTVAECENILSNVDTLRMRCVFNDLSQSTFSLSNLYFCGWNMVLSYVLP